jgi:serine/threonine-protein kinase HipA
MADLVVELYGVQVGAIRGPWRTFDFLTNPSAIAEFGIDSQVLSLAIPLTVVPVRSRAERRRNFFRELLPEGRMLTRLAQQSGLAEQDVIGLLRRYGRDVAGALQIWDAEVPGEPKQPALEALSSAGVAEISPSRQYGQSKIVVQLTRVSSGRTRTLGGTTPPWSGPRPGRYLLVSPS